MCLDTIRGLSVWESGDDNAAAGPHFPGLGFCIVFAETCPFSQVLALLNMEDWDMFLFAEKSN